MESYTNHPLAPYTTVKIGGPADTFIHTQTTQDFIDILQTTNKPITILGNGSNVLISDTGIRGTVVKNFANKIEYLSHYQIKIDSGVQLPLLINDTVDHQLSGLEEFAYIPSSIGGAIVGNIHGINKNNFDKFLVSIDVFNLKTNALENYQASDLKWDYDFSEFKQHPEWIIVSATLQLSTGDSTNSRQIVSEIIAKKNTTQPMNSLGCVFKNPNQDSAGRIIDQDLGLKGFQIGNVQVSPVHANFIVNLGQGTATDYYALIKKIQTEAKAKKNLDLELEITLLGEFSK